MTALKGLAFFLFVLAPGMVVWSVVIGAALFGPPLGLVWLLGHFVSFGNTGDGIAIVAVTFGWWMLARALFFEPGLVAEWILNTRPVLRWEARREDRRMRKLNSGYRPYRGTSIDHPENWPKM